MIKKRLIQDDITVDDHFLFRYSGYNCINIYGPRDIFVVGGRYVKRVSLTGTLFEPPVTIVKATYGGYGKSSSDGYFKDGNNHTYSLLYPAKSDCEEDFDIVIRYAYHDKLPEIPQYP